MFASLVALALAAPPTPQAAFELRDGDRVVWIGNTLVEREQRYGYWETALLAAFPDKNITFRNLGWSGDTVFGDARAAFDPPAKGFERLVSLTLQLKPTVIFVSYGTNESFEGEAGLEKFEAGLNKLLDALKPAKARHVVLFTPHAFESKTPTPTELKYNQSIDKCSSLIAKIAAERGEQNGYYVSLLGLLITTLDFGNGQMGTPPYRITDNGLHFNEQGYQKTADSFRIMLKDLSTRSKEPSEALDWKKLESLRKAIVAKNQLFFYKWRPQNETYLTGFRKHEQGKNAAEIVEFDPLIAEAEKAIRKALDELNPKK